ncbi:signal peptidase I [Massilia sp. TW-1]|uniref:Signal peptidase I n=1 Tax=Telluria antibiotica TaxID=2717319 RepID=A0ABX0P5Q4_9BURK|nr:signal peptidase I [Telluria antibiotica]NIA52566.1 signal peptidase I [Telluria antibiotica]
MKNWVRNNKGFLAFLILFGVFRTAVADWNPIPSASMHPNLLEGDVVLVNRLAFDLKVPLTDVVLAHLGEPHRGDIVTFRSPRDRTLLIKRVVALPGDVVEMRNERLYINGRGADYRMVEQSLDSVGGAAMRALQLAESWDGKGAQPRRHIQIMPDVMAPRTFGPVTVPQGEYLMLGDNRDNSADSRVIGLVPRKLLVGRAERVLVSADYQGNWMPRTERFGMSLYRQD